MDNLVEAKLKAKPDLLLKEFKLNIKRPLKNIHFCLSSSRRSRTQIREKEKILTTPEEYASHSTGQADRH
jgi:hypothetical protein